MKILTHNDSKTVGVVIEPNEIQFCGFFSVELLTEWLEQIKQNLGDDESVGIHFRKSDTGCCYALYASLDNENPYVMIAGRKEVIDETQPAGQEAGSKGTGPSQ